MLAITTAVIVGNRNLFVDTLPAILVFVVDCATHYCGTLPVGKGYVLILVSPDYHQVA